MKALTIKKQKAMSKAAFVSALGKIRASGKVKAQLRALWSAAKGLASFIVRMLQNNPKLVKSFVLGAILAALMIQIPIVGIPLAKMTLLASTAFGAFIELVSMPLAPVRA